MMGAPPTILRFAPEHRLGVGDAARTEGQGRFTPALLEASRAAACDPGWIGASPLVPVKSYGLLRFAAVSTR
jgi:hypothetical protein